MIKRPKYHFHTTNNMDDIIDPNSIHTMHMSSTRPNQSLSPFQQSHFNYPNSINRNSIDVEFPTCSDYNANLANQNKASPPKKEKKKVKHWTKEEHELFLQGLRLYNKGELKNIAKHAGTRTSTQVASHAQKHFNRQTLTPEKRKRKSIYDMTLGE
uniref:Transcription factor DIVARICATA-like n=1 Tax=Cicer arietinum TaxID=3827 RepID=A0A1S2YKQ8_CICAR|nr:transcription factor DIVARICATA-like [Cicer arietinum]